MNKKELGLKVISRLKEIYPQAACALLYENDPYRLLVMARLSAQCTDERVNKVSIPLFAELPDMRAMAEAPTERIEELIRSCGLFRTKARDIKNMSAMLISDFDGKIPDTMDELLSLPGVGRKIANLMLGDVFGQPAVVTDTHCIRICGRLGFYPEELKDPHRIEKILAEILPPDEQSDFCHRIVFFGRQTCMARSPACSDCPLGDICKHNITAQKKKDKNDRNKDRNKVK